MRCGSSTWRELDKMATGGGGASRHIPGYYYDEEKRRYFRTPPERLAYMGCQYQIIERPSEDASEPVVSRPPTYARRDHVRSTFALASHLRTSPDTVSLRRTVAQKILCGSRPSFASPKHGEFRHYTDIMVSKDGILALVGGILDNDRGSQCTNYGSVAKLGFSLENRKVTYNTIGPAVRVENLSGSEYMGIAMCDQIWKIVVLSMVGKYLEVFRMYGDGNEDYEGYCIPNPCDVVLGVVPNYMGNFLCATARYLENSGNGIGVDVLMIRDAVKLCPAETVKLRSEKKVTSLVFKEPLEHLFIGTRSGKVFLRDLRCHSTSLAVSIPKGGRQNPSIVRLHQADDNYLVTNCMDSKMLLWDCRSTKTPVLSYAGYTNSYHSCQSCVDESNQVVMAVNEDKSILAWSTWTGELLRRISPTDYVSDESCLDGVYPGIAHTSRLGGVEGAEALLVCTDEGVSTFGI